MGLASRLLRLTHTAAPAFILLGVVATSALPAAASTIRATYAGSVDTIEDPFGILTPSVVTGAAFSGEILFDVTGDPAGLASVLDGVASFGGQQRSAIEATQGPWFGGVFPFAGVGPGFISFGIGGDFFGAIGIPFPFPASDEGFADYTGAVAVAGFFPGTTVGFEAFDTFADSDVPSRAPMCSFSSAAAELAPAATGFPFAVPSAGLGRFGCTVIHDGVLAPGEPPPADGLEPVSFTRWSGEITSLQVVPEPGHLVIATLVATACGLRSRRRRAADRDYS